MSELVEAQHLVPGDVIINGILEWRITAVECVTRDVTSIKAVSGPAERYFNSMTGAAFVVIRRGTQILQAKRELVAVLGDSLPV